MRNACAARLLKVRGRLRNFVRQNNKTAQQTRSASGAGVFHSASGRSEVRIHGGDFGCWLAEAIPEAWRDER